MSWRWWKATVSPSWINNKNITFVFKSVCLVTFHLKVSAKTSKCNVPQTWPHSSLILTLYCATNLFFPKWMLMFDFFDLYMWSKWSPVQQISIEILKNWKHWNIFLRSLSKIKSFRYKCFYLVNIHFSSFTNVIINNADENLDQADNFNH